MSGHKHAHSPLNERLLTVVVAIAIPVDAQPAVLSCCSEYIAGQRDTNMTTDRFTVELTLSTPKTPTKERCAHPLVPIDIQASCVLQCRTIVRSPQTNVRLDLSPGHWEG